METHLLPAEDASPRCADFASSISLRPAGTGLALDRIIVAAVPLPWPKPALKHDLLVEAASAVSASPHRSRLFAAEPWCDTTVVEAYDRLGTGWRRRTWSCADVTAIGPIVDAIERVDGGDPAPDIAPDNDITVDVPVFLVCTQGSHDLCCGIYGDALAAQLMADRPKVEVRRVSHTGGHRFAPTLLALPSGRMWAFADIELVDRIAAGTETVADLRASCRGWLGAATGPSQAAELAARVAHGAPFSDPPTVAIEQIADGQFLGRISVGTHTALVEVRRGRTVPTVACEAPGGLPAKPAFEYETTVVEDPWN